MKPHADKCECFDCHTRTEYAAEYAAMHKSYTISWRNDLNWSMHHFRVLATDGAEAKELAIELSGQPPAGLGVDPEREGEKNVPLYAPLEDGPQFLYQTIKIYSNRPATCRTSRNGKMMAHWDVCVA